MKKQIQNYITSCVLLILPVVFGNHVSAQVPHSESFDAAILLPPPPWTVIPTPSNYWNRVTSGTNPSCTTHSGAGMARYNSKTTPLDTMQSIVSPVVDLAGIGTDTARVSFWIFRDTGVPTGHDKLSVFINTKKSYTTPVPLLLGEVARLRTDILPDSQATNGWYKYTFDVPTSYFGNHTDTNYVFIRGTTKQGNNIFVDDIQWNSYPSFCSGRPAPGTIVVTDTLLCNGTGATTLTMSGFTGGAGITYQWKSGSSSTGPWNNAGTGVPTLSTGTITSTTYYYSVTTCTTSSLSDSTPVVHVTVNGSPYPTVVATSANNGNYCPGIDVALSGVGANTYTWSPSTGLNVTSGSSVLASPIGTSGTTTIYTVTGRNASGCPGTDTLHVTVRSTTTVTVQAIPNDTICFGDQLILNAGSGGGAALESFLWTPGGDMNQSFVLTPTIDGTYHVQVSNVYGCPSEDSLAIVVITGHTPVINGVTGTNSGIYCIGQTPVKLVSTGSAAISITWSPTTGLSPTTGDTVYASPTTGAGNSTLYTVTYTSDAGCTASDTFRVFRYALPAVTILASPNDTICIGQSVTLVASGPLSSDLITWTPTGSSNDTIVSSPSVNTPYSVHVTGGVSGCANDASINVAVVAVPVAGYTYTSLDSTATFTNTSTNGTSYTWDFGDANGSSLASPPPHTYSGVGPYLVTLYATNGYCTDSVTHWVTLPVGIPEINSGNGIMVMQNPTWDLTIIQFHSDEAKAVLQVMNALGQVVSIRTVVPVGNNNYREEIDMSNLPAGVYSVCIGTTSKTFSRKIIKM